MNVRYRPLRRPPPRAMVRPIHRLEALIVTVLLTAAIGMVAVGAWTGSVVAGYESGGPHADKGEFAVTATAVEDSKPIVSPVNDGYPLLWHTPIQWSAPTGQIQRGVVVMDDGVQAGALVPVVVNKQGRARAQHPVPSQTAIKTVVGTVTMLLGWLLLGLVWRAVESALARRGNRAGAPAGSCVGGRVAALRLDHGRQGAMSSLWNGNSASRGEKRDLGGRSGLVVVGIDGSAPSRAALRFALEDAHRRGARVRVVWAYEPLERWTDYGMVVPLNSDEVIAPLRVEAQRMVAEAVLGDAALDAVPVETRFLPGPAAGVLVAASDDADLLVIGHRGRGGLASALLGSVGLQCALRARCPVVIARPDVPDPSTAEESRATTEAGR